MNMSFLRPTRVIKGTVKMVANVPAWIGYQFLRDNATGMYEFIRPLYNQVKESRQETFEQALIRMNLTEADLQKRASNLIMQSWLFGCLTGAGLIYLVYLLANMHFEAAIVSIFVTGLFAMKMVSARFLLFQIRQRRLGCTLKEWYRGKVGEK